MTELTDFTERRGRDGDRRRSDTSSISQTQAPKYSLTLREQQVLLALSQGHTDQGIAEQLGLSHKTVQHHLRGISFKLGTQNRTKTVVIAIKLGLINL
jgi:DNA-binding NarL/FixJ family response regulator